MHNYGELVQMDIAHMFEDKETNFKYFLLLVDVFSSKVFAEPLKSRETPEIIKALRKIFADFGANIYEIQADRESAFLSKQCQDFFHQKKIIFRSKFGKNKASVGMFTQK